MVVKPPWLLLPLYCRFISFFFHGTLNNTIFVAIFWNSLWMSVVGMTLEKNGHDIFYARNFRFVTTKTSSPPILFVIIRSILANPGPSTPQMGISHRQEVGTGHPPVLSDLNLCRGLLLVKSLGDRCARKITKAHLYQVIIAQWSTRIRKRVVRTIFRMSTQHPWGTSHLSWDFAKFICVIQHADEKNSYMNATLEK